MRIKRITSMAVAMCMLLSMLTFPAHAAGECLQASKTSVKQGDTFTLKYVIPNSVSGVDAITIEIGFDKDKFEATSINYADISPLVRKTGHTITQANANGKFRGEWSSNAETFETATTAANLQLFEANFTVKETAAAGKADFIVNIVEVADETATDLKPAAGATKTGTTVTILKSPISDVSEITAKVDAPEKGMALDTVGTVDSSAPYSIEKVEWYEDPSFSTLVTDTSSAKPNQKYFAKVFLTAKTADGESFDASLCDKTTAEDYKIEFVDTSKLVLTKTFPATLGKTLTGLTVTTPPSKTAYVHGERFDTTGMVVKATYDDGTNNDAFTDYTVAYETSGKDYLCRGNTKVTLNAGSKSVDVTVPTVGAKELTVSDLTAVNREYKPGDKSVTLSGGKLNGVVPGEVVTLGTLPTATVGNDKVADNKAVTISSNLTITGTDAGNYTLTQPTGIMVNITRKDISGANITLGTQATYDGNEQGVAISKVTLDGADLTRDTDYTVKSGGKAINVGDTPLVIEGNGNYKGTASADWSLVAREVTLNWENTAGRIWNDGKAVTATVSNKVGSDDVKVTVTGGDATAVGPHTATATGLTGTKAGNYKLPSPDPTQFYTIDKATATGTCKADFEVRYSDTDAQTVAVANFNLPTGILNAKFKGTAGTKTDDNSIVASYGNDSFTLASSLTASNKGNTASWKVTIESDNYDDINATVNVKVIDKAIDTGTMTVMQAGCIYGDTLSDYVLSGKPTGAGTDTVLYTGMLRSGSSYSSSTAPTEAGTYQVKVECETSDTIYKATSANFTIAPKRISDATVTLSDTSLEYNGGAQTVNVTVEDGSTTLTKGTDYTVTGETNTNVGNYTVTVTGKGNYTDTATADWKITQKALTLAGATATGRSYDKNNKSVDISGVTFTDGTTLNKGTDYTVIGMMDDDNAGSNTVHVTVTLIGLAASNYTLTPNTIDTTVTIAQGTYGNQTASGSAKYGANGTVDLSGLIVAGGTATYTSHTNANNVLDDVPAMAPDGKTLNFAFKDVAANATKTETVKVTVTSTNYQPYEITVTLTVNDKTVPTVTAPTAIAGLEYNGSEQVLIAAGSTTGGTLKYSLTSGSGYDTALPKGKNATSYTVYYKVEGNTEYADVAENSITVNIGKKAVTVAPKAVSITKGSTIPTFELVYTGLVSGESLMPTPDPIFTCYETGTTSVSTSTAAGSYTITWTNMAGTTFTDDANYAVTTKATANLTISNPSSSGGGGSSSGGGGGSSSGGGGGSSAATPSVSDKAAKELKNAKEGSTVTIDMKGETKLPASVTKEIAGKDVTVELDMGGGMVWSFNGLDVPKGGVRLDLGVKTGTKTIPDKVINALTGETTTIQLQLNHNGPFGMSLKLSVDLGKKHNGLYANLYFYNPKSSALEFRSAGMISGGKASWAFDHASDYAIVIDKESHEPMTFTDVPDSAYYAEAVNWAVAKKITGGIGNKLFAPNDPCTRAQIVTFLWRAAGSPAPKSMSSFADVAEDAYYAKAVAWAVENGITGGTGDGKFSPDATCTRAQSVTFLYRAAGSPAVSGSAEFGDVATNAYYADAVAWAAKNGITGGIGGGLFGSGNDCTRGQIVTFLYRAFNK